MRTSERGGGVGGGLGGGGEWGASPPPGYRATLTTDYMRLSRIAISKLVAGCNMFAIITQGTRLANLYIIKILV